MIDENTLLELLQSQIIKSGNNYWKNKLKSLESKKIHLAIMVEPYLSRILNGQKTIESRFSSNKIIPFKRVHAGEIIILKKSGGPIMALFEAGTVRFFEFNNQSGVSVSSIKEKYNDRLQIEDAFWNTKINSKYATLISVQNLLRIDPISLKFANRQSWITMGRAQRKDNRQMTLFDNYKKMQTICIVGEIASGKTTLSKALSASIGCPRYSVSDYLKVKALDRGYNVIDREVLQQVGADCINEGWITFCKNFIDFIGLKNKQTVIIDGIRHKDFFEALKILTSPSKNWMIYLDVDRNRIQERRQQRGESHINYSHLAEGNMQDLKSIADYIIFAEKKTESELSAEIVAILNTILEGKR